jgi:hypothetical protein
MSDDKFFDGGWCWMVHPEFNDGNAIPVKMTTDDGVRWFYPCDPAYALECEWDKRDEQWQMIDGPTAELERAVSSEERAQRAQRAAVQADARIDTIVKLANDAGLNAASLEEAWDKAMGDRMMAQRQLRDRDAASLTKDELMAIAMYLAPDHASSGFEAECPGCTAYRKVKAMLATPDAALARAGA